MSGGTARWTAALGIAAGVVLLLSACSEDASPPAPPENEKVAALPAEPRDPPPTSGSTSSDAKLDTVEMMREDMTTARHPSDGGGVASLRAQRRANGEPGALVAGEYGRLEFSYEAGPMGIEPGGALIFQVSAFWDWDPPQNIDSRRGGYTEVTSEAPGVDLEVQWLGSDMLYIGIRSQRLAPGDRINIFYGAGEIGARVDRFAEQHSQIWFSVDGDGDGIRGLLDEQPSVDIVASPPRSLLFYVPTTARPGEEFEAVLAIVDRAGNAGYPFEGRVQLNVPKGLMLPDHIEFRPEDLGRRRFAGRAEQPGIYRIEAVAIPAQAEDAAETATSHITTSNPMVVRKDIPRVRWADLHGHTQISDGTGTPDDYFRYAREVAGIEIAAITDHDHWGMRLLDAEPVLWQKIKDATRDHHVPGLFVTLLGYEWTSWVHGHRHVIYFKDDGEIYSTLDERYETPAQLWDALRGQPALTFAHHSAGGPISTNWAYPPDPVLEPITEIVSVHGSSEAPDSPSSIYNPVPGNFVRDALDHGYRFGFIGSGDSHDGHPGASHLSSPAGGGLAAIFSETLDRESVLSAMRARHTYATNGARIWLELDLAGHPMGSTIENHPASAKDTQRLRFYVVAEAAIERIDIIRSGRISPIDTNGSLEWKEDREIPRLAKGEYHYIRVVQENGGTAWSSPIYAD